MFVGRVVSELGLPLFVKPANGGSSVGISRVAHIDELEAAKRCGLGVAERA